MLHHYHQMFLRDVNLNDLNSNGGQYNIGNVTTSNAGDNVTLYEVQNAAANSNAMWSDIESTLAELNDEALLEDSNMKTWYIRIRNHI